MTAGRPAVGPDPVRTQVWERIRAGQPPDERAVAAVVEQQRAVLGAGGVAAVTRGLAAAVLGAGPLEALLTEPGVTDVAVNGDGSVWVDRGAGMQRVSVELGDAAARRVLAVRLAASAGRRLDEAAPWCDAVLPSGVRLHAVLPPLVPDGAHLTLRVPSRAAWSLEGLVAAGLVEPALRVVLEGLVRSRVSFVVTGGTGTGKTTLLAALLALVPTDERIVVVEDVRELAVEHPHVVRLAGRSANVEGVGEVTMVALVRQALRMRPDRLVVGEVRGPEVRELLAALNTGHEGGCGTVHANSVADVLARFEALGALAGMDRRAVHAQLVSAVQVVVHLRRDAGGRFVDSVAVVGRGGDGAGSGEPQVRPAWAGSRGGPVDAVARGRLLKLAGLDGRSPLGATDAPAGGEAG